MEANWLVRNVRQRDAGRCLCPSAGDALMKTWHMSFDGNRKPHHTSHQATSLCKITLVHPMLENPSMPILLLPNRQPLTFPRKPFEISFCFVQATCGERSLLASRLAPRTLRFLEPVEAPPQTPSPHPLRLYPVGHGGLRKLLPVRHARRILRLRVRLLS